MHSCDILFIGDTTYDILGMLKQEISAEKTNELTSWEFRYGGKATNAAVSCAKMGAKVAYIGTMGNDFEHLGYREYFASKHVNVDNVFVAGNKTPVYVAFRFGDKNYLFYKPSQPSENELVRLREHFVKHTLASAARIVYCALSSDQLVMEIFKHARQNGKKNAWNPILFSPNPHETKSTLNITDYLFINEVEEEQLVELTKANVSRFYQRHGISVICVTLGERGCRLINKGAVSTIPSTKVEQVFNTTGAGDAFAGAFLGAIALRSFDSIDECAKNASRVAAEVITRQGR